MNNIYKVIWSKAKNCYVVASEIARSHTKSASGSEKIGGVARHALLALGAACAIACGGFVNVGAAVQSETISAGTTSNPVLTASDPDDDAQLTKVILAAREDKLVTKDNIGGQLTDYAKASDLSAKADANTVNDISTRVGTLETTVGNATSGLVEDVNEAKTDITNIKNTIGDASNGLVRDVAELKTQGITLNNALGDKADKSDLEAAKAKITTNEGNIAALKTKTTNLSDDGKALNGMTTVETGVLKVTGGISDGAGVNTTLTDINDSMTQTAKNKADIATLQTTTNNQQTAIDDLKQRTKEISYADGDGTRISGVTIKDGNIVGNGNSAITQLANVETDKIETNEINGKSLTGTTVATEKEVKDVADAVKTETDERKAADTALEEKIAKNTKDIATAEGNITDLKKKDTELEGRIKTNEGDIETNKNAISDINKRTAGIRRIDATKETTIEGNVTVNSLGNVTAEGDVTAKGKLTGDGVDAGAGAITTKGAVNAGSLIVTDASHLKGNVTMDNKLAVTGDTSLKKTDVDGALTVTGESNLKNTTVDGTLTTKGEATFEKNVTAEKDLTVNGTLNTKDVTAETIYISKSEDKPDYKSEGSIIGEGGNLSVSNKKFDKRNNITKESQLNVNEEGTVNWATSTDATGNKTEGRSEVTADNIKNSVKKTEGGTTFGYEENITADGKGGTVTDKAGNTTYTKVTATENSFQVQDKDGKNKNHQVNTKDSSVTEITNAAGATTKTEQTATDIKNTAKDGTITNEAKDIVNTATTMKTTVTDKATESYGVLETTVTGQATQNFNSGLNTTVTGAENHTVTGTQTNTVGGGQINNITGDQTTNVTGDISNKAENITNEAKTKLTDTAGDSTVTTENGKGTTFTKTGSTAYSTAAGAPTDTNIAGNHITTGRVDANELGVSDKDGDNSADLSVKAGKGVKASASDGATTGSLDVTADEVGSSVKDADGKGSTFKQRIDAIMGNVKTDTGESDVTQKGDEITSKVGIGEATNSRVTQKKGSLEAAVTDGTNTNVSYDTANASAKLLTDGTKVNKQQDNLDSSEKTITNGTYKTSTMQSALDITHTAKDGTITHDAKDIVNNASNSITDKVGTNTRVLDNEGITDTVGGSTFKQRIDKIMMESKDVSIKAEETLTNEAKVITNKASEVINNEAIDINNTATGIINSKASEIKNQADKLISNKVGENTSEYMEDGKITTSVKDGAKSTVTIQNADGLQAAVTNGTSTNASATTATSSAQTIASGSKANSVITTIDGTQFVNSDAWAPVTGESGAGTADRTTIKGNTITTGKVTMDYADVMKDLGVRGNANINGKTTTGSLEVTGTSTLKGDVTMESNAIVKKNLTVDGITTTKTLKVTENAEVDGTLKVAKKATFEDSVSIAKDLSVGGDVTANSYQVEGKTYIDKNGIHANGQKITDVADGSISEGSKDAVNGGQLYNVKNDLEGKVNKVGANAAAMANLHPMEFDPDSKWNIAAAIGNYGSETAAALGAFYRPNDDVMVNLSTAFGTGENMVGGGVSVRLGKGGNKLSREESNALKDQVNDLTARMDALLSVLNPNMSKDFPDVPENHWAYEAVSRLAGNDIVQGYPDGEFHGERTMTRYEMAEIIYNALSRGAEAEKELVEEFKPELQAMAASEKATAERAEG